MRLQILETDGVLHTVAYTMEQGSVDTSQLPMGYIRVMLCAAVGCGGLTSNLQRGREEVACLGIGGGSLPAFLCAAFPNTHVWAVDIDPVVISCAQAWMGLPSARSNLTVVIKDAAEAVQQRVSDIKEGTAAPFRVIFLDVYNSDCAVPSHLSGAGFLQDCHDSLGNGGCLVVNLLNMEAGSPTRHALATFICTVLTVFQEAFTLRVPDMSENVVLLALKGQSTDTIPTAANKSSSPSSSVAHTGINLGSANDGPPGVRGVNYEGQEAAQELLEPSAELVAKTFGKQREERTARSVQARAREVGRALGLTFDMGDQIPDVFRVVPDFGIREGFVEVQI